MGAGIRASAWTLAVAGWLAAPFAHAQDAGPLRHQVRAGDTLYDLAQAYLEDPGQWPALARANGNPNPYRLQPGSVILVPDDLLRRKPGGARVVHVSGDVRYTTRSGATGSLERDMRLIDGDRIATGSGGFVTLEMADGSIVRVAGESELGLERLKYSVVKKRAETSMTLDKGRVESRVAPQRPAGGRFEIDTPLMAAGVRGTEFGVSVQAGGAATSDVLHGEVELRVLRSGASSRVRAGVGGAVTAEAPEATLAPLPAAPDLSGVQPLQQRPVVDLAFPPLEGAVAYRAFIWPQGTAEQVADNLVSREPRVRFAGLQDGAYLVRVSGVDARGIEGHPTIKSIELDARPEPPVTLAPEDGGRTDRPHVLLRWAEVGDAVGHRLQVSRNEAFTDPIIDETMGPETSRELQGLASGTYYWRIATIVRGRDGQPDPGPFSEARRFMVRLPVGTGLSVYQEDESVTLRWDGEPGQAYLVQIAPDTGFAQLATEYRTERRQWSLRGLPAGEYFVRIQATDTDGFVREFTSPQRFRINRFVRSGTGSLRTGDGREVHLR